MTVVFNHRLVKFATLNALLASAPLFALEENFFEQRPAESRPSLPAFATPPSALETAPAPAPAPLSAQIRVFARRFELSGNRIFTAAELAQVTAPYENRSISSEELQELRHQLTQYYVERGYINSGAVIPDQQVKDGVIRIDIIEGRLSEVEITGLQWLREGYIKNRVLLTADQPLNVQQLQQRLQLLQQNRLIEQINAELTPGVQPGESTLRLAVKEAKPYEFGVITANDRPPQVGPAQTKFYGVLYNPSGWGDSLGGRYDLSWQEKGTNEWQAFYALPLNAYDTTLRFWYDKSYTTLIEDPFNLNIESKLTTGAAQLSQPVYRTGQQTLTLNLEFALRRSTTYLDGERFSFAAGADNGETRLSVLRFSQEWLDRGLAQVIAARSTFSFGLDIFNATTQYDNPNARYQEPDAQFFSWLGQFQWARRLDDRGNQLIFRTDLQLTDQSLPSMEQCAVGGGATVRGYRENQLVRDACWISSLELRIPLFQLPLPGLTDSPEQSRVQLAPFVDHGRAWNTDFETFYPKGITGAGVGLRWEPSSAVQAALYWGHPFTNIENQSSSDGLQTDGVYFNVRLAYP